MVGMNRRSFTAALAGGAAVLSPRWAQARTACSALNSQAAGDADLVLLNGKIITVDARDSLAEAVAVRDGKIAFVGTTNAVRAQAGPNTKVIDLGGKCVTPGLVDSHLHVLYYGQQFRASLFDLRFPKARTKDDLLGLVAARAKVTPKGEWVVGNQGFSLSVPMMPTLAELDAVSPDHPVYVKDRSGQFGMANSRALRLAGVTSTSRDPLNAKFGRDANGEPNGLLFHYPAEQLIARSIPGYGTLNEQDVLEGQRRTLAFGYTSAQDVIVMQQAHVDLYRALARRGELRTRLYLLRYLNSEQQLDAALQAFERFTDPWLTFGGWKLAIDGGFSAGTGLMYDNSLALSNRAYPFFEQDVLNRMVLKLHKTGLQIAFHACGDRAIDMSLNAVESALNASPRDNHRHRIEHAIFPTPAALERIRKLGMVISVQPQWIAFFGAATRQLCSDALMRRYLPLRTMMNMGIPLAFGCDLPATILGEPRYAFQGAMLRRGREDYVPGPEQRLSMRDALRIHTMGSAYAAFEETTKGSIEPGKLADFVVWSHDLYGIAPRELPQLEASTTIVNGRVIER